MKDETRAGETTPQNLLRRNVRTKPQKIRRHGEP